jgi:hypothetical protein
MIKDIVINWALEQTLPALRRLNHSSLGAFASIMVSRTLIRAT